MRAIIVQTALFIVAILASANTMAQVDTSRTINDQQVVISAENKPAVDENFEVFLLLFAIFMISVMLGIAVAGFFIMMLLFGIFVLMTSIGIISVSLWAGYYKRSLSSGFKVFIYLTCSIAGMILGLAASYFVANMISLNLSNQIILAGGGIAGVVGGLLLANIVSKLSIIAGRYMHARFIQTNQDNR
jgi:hypothetical protein